MRTLTICTLLAGVQGSVEMAAEQTSLLQTRSRANADVASEVLLQTQMAASDDSAEADVDCGHSNSKCKPKTFTTTTTSTMPSTTTPTTTSTTTAPPTTTTPTTTTTTTTTTTSTSFTTTTTSSTTTTGPMDVPPTNCPSPDDARTCHFWGDPHFTHLFFMDIPQASAACPVGTCHKNQNCHVHHWADPCFNAGSKAACEAHGGCFTPTPKDVSKGGRQLGSSKITNFNSVGVFELAKSNDGEFEAQAFFCPAIDSTTTGVGLAMRFGDDLIQVVRTAATAPRSDDRAHPDYYAVLRDSTEDHFTDFVVNGKKYLWDEIGDAAGTRGNNVQLGGGIATGHAFIQQMKMRNNKEGQKTMTPVCVGDGEQNIVEVGTPHFEVGWSDRWPVVYEHAVTIRSSDPEASGICGSSEEEVKDEEQFRVDPKKNLFSTRQMKTLCDMCRLDMKDGACGAPGHTATAEDVCLAMPDGASVYHSAKETCAQHFAVGSDWFSTCVMETCVSGLDAVAITKIEQHLQDKLNSADALGRPDYAPQPSSFPGTCSCTMTSDNDIDYVYVDGADVTRQVTPYKDLGNWPTNKQLTFECNEHTKMAVQASDGNGGASAGCQGGGFGMLCKSTNSDSPWHGLETDGRWKAWGAQCTTTPCKYAGSGDDKNTYNPPAPANWFANDFDDSQWKQADAGNYIGKRTGAKASICSKDGPGWLFRSPDFATTPSTTTTTTTTTTAPPAPPPPPPAAPRRRHYR